MKALVWCAPYKVQVENVPDPKILNRRDAIVRITSSCICGSDLHLVDGFIPFMKPGDILGHEPMGIVEELGPDVDQSKVKKGDRVVVPFFLGCGKCFFCKRGMWSACDNTNPKSYIGEAMLGEATAGVLGYSHMTGGFAGGQAEYLRVPLADVNLQKMPEDLTDHQLVFLSDIFPTGYMAVEQCGVQPDDTVAVWGCGPVGQFTIRSAMLLGAAQVIAIDDRAKVPERLKMAEDAGAITIDMHDEYVYDRLLDLTAGLGPDICIDAVGMEAHGSTIVETSVRQGEDEPVHGDGAAGGGAAGDHVLPEGRHGFDPGSVRRLERQVPARCADEQGPDDQDRSDARAQVRAGTAQAGARREDRSELRRDAPVAAERGGPWLRYFPREEGRLHQSRA